MTTKMQSFRKQPLLEPPSERQGDWLTVTDADRKVMLEYLQTIRDHPGGSTFLGYNQGAHYFFMQELGAPVEVGERDKFEMTDLVRGICAIDQEMYVADNLYYLRMMGVEVDGEKYLQNMLTGLQKTRDDTTISLRGFSGMMLASQHYHMKALGFGQQITTDDEGAMFDDMTSHRKSGDGEKLAPLLYYMNKLGYGQTVTAGDKIIFKQTIEKMRENKDGLYNGLSLSHMQYMVGQLLPEGDVEETKIQLPPLKKI